MSIDNKHIDFSLSQEDTLLLQTITRTPQPELPTVPRTPKKTHLKQLSLSGTTSVVMQAIRRVPVERLHEYFEQACDRRQQETAVICGSSEFTYLELDQRANQLAHFLISHGVGKSNPIGILLDRSLDTYVALLGILKAGAAFVPLDPSFPSDMVAFIAADADLCGLVTTSAFRKQTKALPCPVLELDQSAKLLSVQSQTRPQLQIDPASLCYIIYTLGNANRLKGIAVSHSSIVNLLRIVTVIYGVNRNDRVYQGMSIAFDFSFEEIWPTWIAGATLVVDPTGFQSFGHELTELLTRHKITVLYCTPALLTTIERDVSSLRCLIIGGEPCPPALVSRWSSPGRRMLNTYGHAETTVTATWRELFPGRPITLGSPLPTYQIYLLDKQFQPVADGQIGEICIGGPGVALGYLNRPDLTRERFIPNPVLQDRAVVPRLYRTGDLGRFTLAGEIEYLGQSNARDRLAYNAIAQMVLPPINVAPSRPYAPAPQLAPGATPIQDAKTSTLETPNKRTIKNFYKQVMTDPLYKNSIFNMASTLILGGLGFIFWIIIARFYKPEDVGIATTLISVMTLLSSFTILGFNVSLNRYLPKSTRKDDLINSTFIVTAFAAVLASAIFLAGLQVFSPQLLFLRSNIFYIISFTIFVIFCSWNVLTESVSMAFRAASTILVKNTIISVFKLLLPIAFIAFGAYGIFTSTAFALTLGVLFGLIILIIKFRIRPAFSVNISLLKETATYSFANFITDFTFYMPSLILPIFILNILSAKYVAYYYVASMIQSILFIVPLAASQALLTEGAYNEHALRTHVKKAFTTILVILVPATLAVIFGGNLLLQVFGKSYASEALQFLRLYSASTIFTSLILISNAIMNVKHQIKSLVFLNIVAAIVTIWLSYAFISAKLVGIGWGWLLGQVIAGALSLFFIARNLYSKK